MVQGPARSSPARSCASCSPARSSNTARCSSAAPWSWPASWSSRCRELKGQMEDILKHWGPSVAVFAPLVGAALMMLVPRVEEELHKWIALLTTLFVFATTIGIATVFDFDRSGDMQFLVNHKWIEVINSRYIIGIDGISLPLILLTGLVVPLCVIYSWNHFPEPHNPKAFLILILILETGMIGTFVAEDRILFC